MQIAFWSHYRQISTTCNTIAVAVMTALEYRLKTLITHNHFEGSTLESSFLSRDYLDSKSGEFSDIGIDALSRFIKFNNVDKDNISNFTTTLVKNSLDLLIGTTSTNKALYQKELQAVIDMIMVSANKYYDLVFVDAASGSNELSKKILKNSDLVVVNLNQNCNVLEEYFARFGKMADKSVFLLGRYDNNSRFNMKTLRRKYELKSNIAVIPYNIEFADACCVGNALDFFLKNLKADRDDLNHYFMQEVRGAVQLILKKLNIDITLKKIGD